MKNVVEFPYSPGGTTALGLAVKNLGKCGGNNNGDYYAVHNDEQTRQTGVVQCDTRQGDKSWQLVTVEGGENVALGCDRPDFPVELSWYKWTIAGVSKGDQPRWPKPTGPDAMSCLGIGNEAKYNNRWLINRECYRPITVHWKTPTYEDMRTIEPGQIAYAASPVTAPIEILSAQLGFPSLDGKVVQATTPSMHRIGLTKGYEYLALFALPGPFPCGSNSTGWSDLTNAGSLLGSGRFFDYFVMCAGITTYVYYNKFEQENIKGET